MLLSRRTIFLPFVFASIGAVRAATIYVDQTISGNCTSGNYSIANHSCSGSDGNAYTTIQAALNAMKPGDTVFMRGGTYTEGVITIPLATSGDSLHWSSLQSYQGEWAILDGQNKLPKSGGDYMYGLGYRCESAFNCEHHFWKFSRFEMKNCRQADDSCAIAIWISGGPFIFDHLYLHDNFEIDANNNPSAIRSYRMHDSKVQYCYFNNNGGHGSHNCAQINIFSDYQWAADSLVDINHAIRKNEISYNLFDSAYAGYKHKGTQLLVKNHSGIDVRYKDYGDKIHHNIFKHHLNPIMNNQDFTQYYNNIIDSGEVQLSEITSTGNDRIKIACYNNTVNHVRLTHCFDYADIPAIFHPYILCVNNISDSAINAYDQGAITVGLGRTSTQTLVPTDMHVDRNLIYRIGSAFQYCIGAVGNGVCMGFITTTNIDSCYGYTNYTTSLPGLFKGTTGSDRYKTNGSFPTGSGTTVANGGIGGPHPFLDGVTLPTYVGAIDPNDDGWVDTVLALVNLPKSFSTIKDSRLPKASITSGMTFGIMKEREGKVDVEVNTGVAGKYCISIFAISGKMLWKQNIHALSQLQKISWNCTGVGNGTYLVVLSRNDRNVGRTFSVMR